MTDKDLIEYLRTDACVHPETGKRRFPSDEDDEMFELAADRIEKLTEDSNLQLALDHCVEILVADHQKIVAERDELKVYADQQKADQKFGKHLTEKLGITHEFRHVVGGALYLLYAEVEKLRDENAGLHQAAQAVLFHDERGQGMPFQEAMDRLHRLVIEDRK